MMVRVWTVALAAAVGCTSTGTTGGGPSGGPNELGAGDAAGGDADVVEPVVEIGPGWLRGEHPEDLPEETHVIAAAAHEDEAEAHARAVIDLERAVWGPVPDRPSFASLPPVFAEGDPTRREKLEDSRVGVLVAVARETIGMRVEDWLDDAAADLLRERVADEPGPRIEAAIAKMKSRALEIFGCERRRAVARQECQPVLHGEPPLRMAATLVHLRPALEGGIPRFPDQPPLRPAGVRVLWQTEAGDMAPWAGAPVVFEAAEGVLATTSAVTGANGVAEVAFAGEPGDEPIAVALDAGEVFGEFAADWPGTGTELRLRTVTTANARVAVHLFEHISQEPTDERTTTEAVARRLRRLGYRGALVLPEDLTVELDDARAGRFKAAVRNLASTAAGKADVIVMGDVHSDFLSRAVGRSVWHEAVANVKVYDLWTGRHIGDAERETRAKGMGDFNAARKAMRALGEDVAVAVHDLISEGMLTASVEPAAELANR